MGAAREWTNPLEATERGRILLEQERVILEATESICDLLENTGTSHRELAKRLGKSPPFVSKLLSGENNFTLRTLAEVYFHLDRSVHVTIGPRGDELRVPIDPCAMATTLRRALESLSQGVISHDHALMDRCDGSSSEAEQIAA